MTPGLIVVIAIVAVTLIVTLIVTLVRVSRALDRRYRGHLLDWATARGWTYRDGGGGEWTSLLPEGDWTPEVKLQLDGSKQGRPLTVAHYEYQTTSTSTDSHGHRSRSTTTHPLTVVVVWLAASYPMVVLTRRGLGLGWGLAVSRAVGRQPTNLTGVAEFDRRYRIHTGKDGGGAASAAVTPEVIRAYLTSDLPLWGLSSNQLVITWPGAIKADDLDQKVDQALMIAGLLDRPAPRPQGDQGGLAQWAGDEVWPVLERYPERVEDPSLRPPDAHAARVFFYAGVSPWR